jgi:hypothetical protein
VPQTSSTWRSGEAGKVENEIGETGVLAAFSAMKGSSRTQTNQFCRKFYGKDTSSHGGRNHYRRPRLLDNDPLGP